MLAKNRETTSSGLNLFMENGKQRDVKIIFRKRSPDCWRRRSAVIPSAARGVKSNLSKCFTAGAVHCHPLPPCGSFFHFPFLKAFQSSGFCLLEIT